MKIGILTFHKAYNYGAILQAFALEKKINLLGYDCEIIDYLGKEKARSIKLFVYNQSVGAKENLSNLIKDLYRFSKRLKFNRFMKSNLSLSNNQYSSLEEMRQVDKENIYDVYIVGSDQVWNVQNNHRDQTFLLGFVSNNYKKCSYAASLGNSVFDEDIKRIYERELSSFRVLSVREESAIEEYCFLSDNGAVAVLDPTLLLDEKIYGEITNKRIIKKPYAFLYTISKDKKLRSYARKYCQENGLILIDSKKSLKFFLKSSPSDFLSFVKYVDIVFTNSFHGTAFSIIFKKKFVTEVNTDEGFNSRSYDLMLKTGLQSRDLDDSTFGVDNTISYESAEEKLEKQRLFSENILKKICEN